MEKTKLKGFYIARDKNGWLQLYVYKPTKDKDQWRGKRKFIIQHEVDNFPSVKWEDEEPTEVDIIVQNKTK